MSGNNQIAERTKNTRRRGKAKGAQIKKENSTPDAKEFNATAAGKG